MDRARLYLLASLTMGPHLGWRHLDCIRRSHTGRGRFSSQWRRGTSAICGVRTCRRSVGWESVRVLEVVAMGG
eukprot:751548-Hanusia_phi.AAC.3